jgi:hypothetical protein
MRSPIAISIVFAIALSFPVLGGAGDEGILPPEGYLEVWHREGDPSVFPGEALYDHINGGAETYLELGFEACTVQRYRRDKDEYILEIYKMADPLAALGIYLTSCGNEAPDPSLSVRHTVGRNQLSALKGRHLLKITAYEESSRGRPHLLELAGFCIEKIPDVESTDLLKALPSKGLVEGSVRVVRGFYGLQAFATLGEGNCLKLGPETTALAGEYDAGEGKTTSLLVADYPSAEAAAAALKHLRANLDSYLEVVGESESGIRFKDHAGRPGEVSLDGSRITVRIGP